MSWINPRIQPGEVRKVVTGVPGKTGVVYTLDRETGEFLWATPTVSQNVINDIDGATGAVTENAEVTFTALGQEVLACPTWAGGKDWEAGAYSPLTNTMYMPLRNTCARMLATDDVRSERARALTAGGQGGLEIYALAARHQITPGEDQLGTIYAVSAETGRTAWLHEQRAATMSVMATGGGLVFGGDVNGRFRALDQETGAVLWENQPRLAGRRLSDRLRGGRTPVRGRQHRRRRRSQPPPDARAAPQRGERPVRVRPALTLVLVRGGPRRSASVQICGFSKRDNRKSTISMVRASPGRSAPIQDLIVGGTWIYCFGRRRLIQWKD